MIKPAFLLNILVLTAVIVSTHGMAHAASPATASSKAEARKNTLIVTPKNSSPITFSNINFTAANSVCVALGGGQVNKNTSSCIYNKRPLTNPGLSYKNNDKIKLLSPEENSNQTI